MIDADKPLALWAGAECTVVRVGDDYRDQLVETGHDHRIEDLDLFAQMGVETVRFPILWERIAPASLSECDWRWTDSRLERLRALGIDVIGGLLHHGSGPLYTDLIDPDFSKKLAEFAARAAERYPWITHWTPVNEPLTTARFSALYGHWYPHRRDYPSFLRALLNQCRGTLEAMAAIRGIIPHAKLVQTEDLGKTFSTVPLRHQAAHENGRRWLSFDLLCGRVTPDHPWHALLQRAGIGVHEIDAFATGAATPDIIGINHYLTSERFLDHRLYLYPHLPVGGNGRDTYVDAEAVRVKRLQEDVGGAPRLRECWARYGLPIAITEVHHGCNRPEQLRWLAEVWQAATALREEGMELRAVTLWSMFGNVDWRFLLAERRGHYDTGAYDVRGGTPRPTVVARAAAAYAKGESFDHPVLDMPGWWRRPPRLYSWSGRMKPMEDDGRKLLITGATGTLGKAMSRTCEDRALPFVLTDREQLDICDPAAIEAALLRHRPWAVINTAGFVRVADAEAERDACFAWNSDGAANLATACAAADIPFVTFSSDLVFDGRLGRTYVESDPVSPANVYGASKADAERRVLAAHERALVIRTAAFFSPWDRYNFAWAALSTLAEGRRFAADPHSFVSPTYVPDLCHAAIDLLVDDAAGLWHLATPGRISWYELAVSLAERAGLDGSLIDQEPGQEEVLDNSLASHHGAQLRPLEEAIADFVAQVQGELAPHGMRVAAE